LTDYRYSENNQSFTTLLYRLKCIARPEQSDSKMAFFVTVNSI
jgi:hypothetical protein